jgi:DNA-binding XRE family transcriptional regulator
MTTLRPEEDTAAQDSPVTDGPVTDGPVTEDEAALRRVIGKRIRTERIWRDLSQQDLAEQAGVTRNFISAIERGAQGLDGYRLLRIADTLGLTMTDLFGVTGAEHRPGRAGWDDTTQETHRAPRP